MALATAVPTERVGGGGPLEEFATLTLKGASAVVDGRRVNVRASEPRTAIVTAIPVKMVRLEGDDVGSVGMDGLRPQKLRL